MDNEGRYSGIDAGLLWDRKNKTIRPGKKPRVNEVISDKNNIRAHEMAHVSDALKRIKEAINKGLGGLNWSQACSPCKGKKNDKGKFDMEFDEKKCSDALKNQFNNKVNAIVKAAFAKMTNIGSHNYPNNPVEEIARTMQNIDIVAGDIVDSIRN